MERRNFIKNSVGAALAMGSFTNSLTASILNINEPLNSKYYEELKSHKIDGIEYSTVKLNYPRQAGKNAKLGIFGSGQSHNIATLKTDKGASGWGIIPSDNNDYDIAFETIKGKPITDYFLAEKGLINQSVVSFDIPLHDLAGQILQKPVYKLLGDVTPQTAPCYSGMIYFDDLEESSKSKGLD
jgi:L-alanine-DL-glutamate epimerase-like enolase superfamily enzyme